MQSEIILVNPSASVYCFPRIWRAVLVGLWRVFGLRDLINSFDVTSDFIDLTVTNLNLSKNTHKSAEDKAQLNETTNGTTGKLTAYLLLLEYFRTSTQTAKLSAGSGSVHALWSTCYILRKLLGMLLFAVVFIRGRV